MTKKFHDSPHCLERKKKRAKPTGDVNCCSQNMFSLSIDLFLN